jgi:hypothetical protein
VNHSDHSDQASGLVWVAEPVMVAVFGEILLLGPIGLPGMMPVLRTSVVVGRIGILGTLVRIGMIPVLRTSVVVGRIAMLGTLVRIGMIAMLGMLLVILLLVGEPTTPLGAVDSLLADFDVLTALSLKVIVSVRVGRAVPLKVGNSVTVSAGNVGAGNPDTM